MASLPIWMEGVINKKYPKWRDLEKNEDSSARYMPAGVRLVETSLLREYKPDDIVACFPEDLHKFVGPRTRVVAVSTHNPLGVTFAAGVYTSIFGSSRMPINSHYSRELFAQYQSKSVPQQFQSDRRRFRWLADHPNGHLRRARCRLCRRRTQRVS